MLSQRKPIKKRRKFSGTLLSIVIFVLIFGFISFLAVSNFRINQKRSDMLEQIRSLEQELQKLEEQRKNLETTVEQSQEESYWEGKVREQGYQKPGEEAVVILPSESSGSSQPAEGKNFFKKIWEKLGF